MSKYNRRMKDTERSEQTKNRARPSLRWTEQTNGFGEAKTRDERKEDRRPFPGGCFTSNTILPKLGEEMKWAPPSANTINSL